MFSGGVSLLQKSAKLKGSIQIVYLNNSAHISTHTRPMGSWEANGARDAVTGIVFTSELEPVLHARP